jgi:stage V sporulation protein R
MAGNTSFPYSGSAGKRDRMMAASEAQLQDYSRRLERLARTMDLDFYPVDFELVPPHFMTEIAVYGLPVRMPHWSFGVRYFQQMVRQSMGHSRIFEVMFPGKRCHAYLVDENSLAENTLVVSHVLGHADFAKNNYLFVRSMEMADGRILERAAAHARRIEDNLQIHGQEKVEAVLDAALSLEAHVDIDKPLRRPPYPCPEPEEADRSEAFGSLHRTEQRTPAVEQPHHAGSALNRAKVSNLPPQPEWDLLWFIANHAPDMEDWERDIFLAVREESFYFYPVFACQIMNEGWASYWHARLLREADFLPDDLYLKALKVHSDVVSPFASDSQLALEVNPYHLGFAMWEHLIEQKGIAAARQIMQEEDDFSFIRNYLDAELVQKLDLFVYGTEGGTDIRIVDRDVNAIREAILKPRYNYGVPRIAVSRLHRDGSLELIHDYRTDGSGLDLAGAERVLEYIGRVWRRPVSLCTTGINGSPKILSTHKH